MLSGHFSILIKKFGKKFLVLWIKRKDGLESTSSKDYILFQELSQKLNNYLISIMSRY